MTDLGNGLHLRTPCLGDAAAVAGLINFCAVVESGLLQTTVERLRSAWQADGFDLGRDAWLVTAPSGDVVGYAEVCGDAAGITSDVRVCVHPDYLGGGLWDALFDLVEAQVKQAARVTLRAAAISVDHAARRRLYGHGFRLAARVWHHTAADATLASERRVYRCDVYEKELTSAPVAD